MKLDYWNGIVLTKKGVRVILTNEYGYLGHYWGYRSFRPLPVNSIWDLEQLKSEIINDGGVLCWDTYQWLLVNFESINPHCQSRDV